MEGAPRRPAAAGLLDPVRWWADRDPDRAAVVTTGRGVTYGQLWQWHLRVAGLLRERGVRPGDRVAIVGTNTVDWCVLALGILAAGGVVAPLNVRWVERELRYAIDDAAPVLVVVDDERLPSVTRVLERSDAASALMPMSDVARCEHIPAGPDPTIRCDGDDLAVLVYTSGSTSDPKGVMFTHGGVLAAAAESALVDPAFGDSPRYLLCLPLPGCAGIIRGLLVNLVPGGTVYLENAVDADRAIDLIEGAGITVFNSMPFVFERIAESPRFRTADLSSLRLTTVAGAPVPPDLLVQYAERGVLLRQSWGQTEVAGSCTINAADLAVDNPELCGRGGVFTRLRTVRPDGTDCAPAEVGEIVVRGPCVTPGYWNKPEETAAAFLDGWFRSGDLGTLDERGNLAFVGRRKEIVISGGLNIAPAEIELVLASAPGVVDAVVLGVPDERFGEAVAAVVHLTPDGDVAVVQQHCFERLADFKVPRRIVVAPAPLPRLPNGKFARPAVRAQFGADLAALDPVVHAQRGARSR